MKYDPDAQVPGLAAEIARLNARKEPVLKRVGRKLKNAFSKPVPKPKPEPEEMITHLQCPLCRLKSGKIKFHVGKISSDTEYVKVICPKCTNVFMPYEQEQLIKYPKSVHGLIWEDNINAYCNENMDSYLLINRGKVPRMCDAIDIQRYKAEVPEKHWRE